MRNLLLSGTSLVVFGAETGTASAAPRELPDLSGKGGNLFDATEEMSAIKSEMAGYRDELRTFQERGESLVSKMSRTLTKYALRRLQGGFFIQGEGEHAAPQILNLEQLREFADGQLQLKTLEQEVGGSSRLKISPQYASRVVSTACKAALLAATQFDGFCVAPFIGNTIKIAVPGPDGKYPLGTQERVAAVFNNIEPNFVGAKDRPDAPNKDASLVPVSAAQIDISYAVKFENKKRDQYGKLVKGADEEVTFKTLVENCMKVFGMNPENGEVTSGNTSGDFEVYALNLPAISDLKTRLQDIEGACMAGISEVEGERKFDAQKAMQYMVNEYGVKVAEQSGAKKVANARK